MFTEVQVDVGMDSASCTVCMEQRQFGDLDAADLTLHDG